jgi:diaminohydroxyphosphoribosylaminopyrimidine deaminase / 5-amino-6-(5-phosphoribosylamino)uracil reductase
MTTPRTFASPVDVMRRAIELARRGEGRVEPNPMVGAVIVDESLNLLGEGWHERFGAAHAEVNALSSAGERARGATMYVTLEPCCHVGKTPPCVDALLAAGISRVVIGMQDPFPRVAGGGIARLCANGVGVEVGLLAREIQGLNAPFRKLVATGRPWVHVKWAMTLDGKIASRAGHSRWISNEASRRVVHELRGRMDAIVIGSGTALADDPLLTPRPPGPRLPARVVIDRRARLPLDSQLVRTAREAPVIVFTDPRASSRSIDALRAAGVEVLSSVSSERVENGQGSGLARVLAELGRRDMTNILVEGGPTLAGALFDEHLIDEIHVFIAPKLVGGKEARSPLDGVGFDRIPEGCLPVDFRVEALEGDLYVHARIASSA